MSVVRRAMTASADCSPWARKKTERLSTPGPHRLIDGATQVRLGFCDLCRSGRLGRDFLGPVIRSRPLTHSRPSGFLIYVAASPARSIQRVKLSTPRRSFSQEFLTPLGTQDFHLRFEPDHARRDSFIFFGDAGDRSRYRALIDQALELFIRTQAQHFFAATGSVSFPKIKQDDVEQRIDFE